MPKKTAPPEKRIHDQEPRLEREREPAKREAEKRTSPKPEPKRPEPQRPAQGKKMSKTT